MPILAANNVICLLSCSVILNSTCCTQPIPRRDAGSEGAVRGPRALGSPLSSRFALCTPLTPSSRRCQWTLRSALDLLARGGRFGVMWTPVRPLPPIALLSQTTTTDCGTGNRLIRPLCTTMAGTYRDEQTMCANTLNGIRRMCQRTTQMGVVIRGTAIGMMHPEC
jgi:hypothetical protein